MYVCTLAMSFALCIYCSHNGGAGEVFSDEEIMSLKITDKIGFNIL